MTTKEKFFIIATDETNTKTDIVDLVCMALDCDDLEQSINDFYSDNYKGEEQC